MDGTIPPDALLALMGGLLGGGVAAGSWGWSNKTIVSSVLMRLDRIEKTQARQAEILAVIMDRLEMRTK